MKNIGIIGVTGSVGSQGLNVALLNKDKFNTVFITAHSDKEGLEQAAEKLNPKYSLLTKDTENKTIIDIINEENIDIVLFAASSVHAVSLVYDIVNNGTDIALANKESIVTAGSIIMAKAQEKGVNILPVDSEHSAIYQCLMGQNKDNLHKITLTASGGPFRFRPKDAFDYIIREDALKHPNWSMGSKITIDSATMMNKGLELIEAKYLFDIEADKLEAIIHPESIVHSYVTFKDGSTIAQMGLPNMQTPIAFALSYPERISSGVPPVELWQEKSLTFYKPDLDKFKCLDIAVKVLHSGSNALMTAMNAANEVAVYSFLKKEINFQTIPCVIEEVLEKVDMAHADTIDNAMENIRKSSILAEDIIKKFK